MACGLITAQNAGGAQAASVSWQRRRRRQSRLTSISTRSPTPTDEHANVDNSRCLLLSREGWARQLGRASAACALAAAGGNPRPWRDTIPLLSRSSCPWSLPTRPREAVQQDMHGCGRATAISVRQLMTSTRGSAGGTMAAGRRRRPRGAPCCRPPAKRRRVNSFPADHARGCCTACVFVVVERCRQHGTGSVRCMARRATTGTLHQRAQAAHECPHLVWAAAEHNPPSFHVAASMCSVAEIPADEASMQCATLAKRAQACWVQRRAGHMQSTAPSGTLHGATRIDPGTPPSMQVGGPTVERVASEAQCAQARAAVRRPSEKHGLPSQSRPLSGPASPHAVCILQLL